MRMMTHFECYQSEQRGWGWMILVEHPANSEGGENAEVRTPCSATQVSPFPPHNDQNIWDKNSSKQMFSSFDLATPCWLAVWFWKLILQEPWLIVNHLPPGIAVWDRSLLLTDWDVLHFDHLSHTGSSFPICRVQKVYVFLFSCEPTLALYCLNHCLRRILVP